MLDARIIGAYISNLRKEKEFTQVELADQLNVTHQAVSKWERGESIPDIGTLMNIADLFHVSVDNILYGKKSVHISNSTWREGIKKAFTKEKNSVDMLVEELKNNNPEKVAEMLNSKQIEVDTFVDVAPLLKAKTISNVTTQMEHHLLTLDKITQLAPFVERDALQQLMDQISLDEVEWNSIVALTPFLDQEGNMKLISKLRENLSLRQLAQIAPFIGNEIDNLLTDMDIEYTNGNDLVALAPFLQRNSLDLLIQKLKIEDINLSHIKGLAPFLHSTSLAEMIDKLQNNDFTVDDIIDIAPFLPREKISEWIVNSVNQAKN